jgi:hypothetical protein
VANKDDKSRVSKDRDRDADTKEKSGKTEKENDDERPFPSVRSENPEPTGNLRKRAEWFQKRHRS